MRGKSKKLGRQLRVSWAGFDRSGCVTGASLPGDDALALGGRDMANLQGALAIYDRRLDVISIEDPD